MGFVEGDRRSRAISDRQQQRLFDFLPERSRRLIQLLQGSGYTGSTAVFTAL